MTELTPDQKAIVLKAADEIERRGLAHGMLQDRTAPPAKCKVCTLGGLALARFGDPRLGYEIDDATYGPIVEAVAAAITERTPLGGDDAAEKVYHWNDEKTPDEEYVRSTEEVVTFLRKLAA